MDSPGNGRTLKASPNVTPLVDVVLVLLILFIVLLPAVDDSVRLPRARHASPREEDAEPVPLVLAKAGAGPGLVSLEVGRGRFLRLPFETPVERAELVARLRGRLAGPGGRRFVLKADGGLPFRHIQTLLDLCREAGAEVVSAATAPDQPQLPEGGLS